MDRFNEDILIVEHKPGLYGVNIAGNWSVNGNPNGGYLMAIMAGAMIRNADKKSMPIMTANYMARCDLGKAEVYVEEISRSVQFNRYVARLMQDGNLKVIALGTFSVEREGCALDHYETGAPELAPIESCIVMPELSQYTLFHNLEMRLDPACAGWLQNETAEKSEQKGWVKFKEDTEYDILSLFLIADSIPPAILASQGPIAWVPTLELSTNIRNMPQTQWLKFILRTRFITCGFLEADGEIWDDAGNLISISRQIAQVKII